MAQKITLNELRSIIKTTLKEENKSVLNIPSKNVSEIQSLALKMAEQLMPEIKRKIEDSGAYDEIEDLSGANDLARLEYEKRLSGADMDEWEFENDSFHEDKAKFQSAYNNFLETMFNKIRKEIIEREFY